MAIGVGGNWYVASREGSDSGRHTGQTKIDTGIVTSDQRLAGEVLIYDLEGTMGLMDEKGGLLLDGEAERITAIESLPNSMWFECLSNDSAGFYYSSESGQRLSTEAYSMDEKAFLESDYSPYYDRTTGAYGIVDKYGKMIVEPPMMEGVEGLVSENSHFMTALFDDGTRGVLNTEGQLLGETYQDVLLVETLDQQLQVVVAHINREGFGIFHSEKGLVLSPQEVEDEHIAYIAAYDYAPVTLYSTDDGLDGLIDSQGEIVRDEEGEKRLFSYISSFSARGYASARTLTNESVIIDQNGLIVADASTLSAKNISNLSAFSQDGKAVATFSKAGEQSIGVVDEQLNVLATIKKGEVASSQYLGQNLLAIRESYYDQTPALITTDGEEIISQEEAAEEAIHEIGNFTQNGLSVVSNLEYDEGLIDQNGHLLFPIEEGTSISINQYKNIFEVKCVNETTGASEIIYINSDGALLYRSDQEAQLMIGEERIMIVSSTGETAVFDENGRSLGTVRVNVPSI